MAVKFKDYYEVLGVKRGATDEQIQQALSSVLCRCFGNVRMLKAISRYAKGASA